MGAGSYRPIRSFRSNGALSHFNLGGRVDMKMDMQRSKLFIPNGYFTSQLIDHTSEALVGKDVNLHCLQMRLEEDGGRFKISFEKEIDRDEFLSKNKPRMENLKEALISGFRALFKFFKREVLVSYAAQETAQFFHGVLAETGLEVKEVAIKTSDEKLKRRLSGDGVSERIFRNMIIGIELYETLSVIDKLEVLYAHSPKKK